MAMGRETLKALLAVITTLGVVYGLLRVVQAWQPDFDGVKAERLKRAQRATGPVHIAVAWTPTRYNRGFLQGIETAVMTLNRGGGILGRPVKTKLFTGRDKQMARDIAAATEFPVVIGHETSAGAIPASVTYNRAGILYIAPCATHPDLTVHGFSQVLRSVPDDRDMVLTLAAEGALQGVQNLAVLTVRSPYGRSLRMRVEQYAEDNGINVSYSKSYSESKADFRQLAYELKGENVDAVFIGDYVPRAAYLIRQLREQRIMVPILGTDGLDDSETLWEIAGAAANDTYVVSVYLPPGTGEHDRPAASAEELRFVSEYKSRHKTSPDVFAATAYDAVMLYAQGVEKSKTTDPLVVSSMLKYGGPFQGLIGPSSFDTAGNAVGKKLVMKAFVDGEFRLFQQEGRTL